jgi:NADPH:quinone reductase-like Zn-dependent oxidoreductase
MRVLIRSLALAVTLAAVPLASVAAHECIVVNRSDTGNEHATASGRWMTVTLTDIYESTEFHGLPDLTATQVAYAADLAGSWGVPDGFTFRSDKLIPPSEVWDELGHATDGKGIDHFFDVYGERLVGALFEALANA